MERSLGPTAASRSLTVRRSRVVASRAKLALPANIVFIRSSKLAALPMRPVFVSGGRMGVPSPYFPSAAATVRRTATRAEQPGSKASALRARALATKRVRSATKRAMPTNIAIMRTSRRAAAAARLELVCRGPMHAPTFIRRFAAATVRPIPTRVKRGVLARVSSAPPRARRTRSEEGAPRRTSTAPSSPTWVMAAPGTQHRRC